MNSFYATKPLLYGLKDPKTDQNHNQMIDLKEWFESSSLIVQ